MSWMQCGETLERGDRGCRIRHPAVHLGAAVCAPNLNKPKHLAPEGGQPSWNVAVAHPLAMQVELTTMSDHNGVGLRPI